MEHTRPLVIDQPLDGRVLGGRYELQMLIGRGGMANVYRARDRELNRDVAVKVFRTGIEVPDEVARREVEVQLASSLNHPHIVGVYDVGTCDEDPLDPCVFLVLELVEGLTLTHRIAGGPIASAEVAAVGAQLAEALAYMHAQGIVHRDVKPANVLLTVPERAEDPVVAKLTDFGVARHLDSDRLTDVGMTIGTANYLSPEHVRGEDVGPPSDVYALGLVLLECLTGQVAYGGRGVEAAVARLHRPPTIPASLGPEWVALLQGMTASLPEQRPSAAAAASQLRTLDAGGAVAADAAATAVLGPIPVVQAAPNPEARRRRLGILLAAGSAIALLFAVLLTAGNGSGGTSQIPPPVTTPAPLTTPVTQPSHVATPTPTPKPTPEQKKKGPGHGKGRG